MGSIFVEVLNAGGVAPALNLVSEKLSDLATAIKLPALAMFVLGAIVALLVGSLGYKYIKLFSTICFAAAGYGIGEALFRTAKVSFAWDVPDFANIIAGVVLLVLMAVLAYKKFAYALFGLAAFIGFFVMYLLVPNYIIAIAVGVVVAMLAMCFVRYAFVILTSLVAGYFLMAMISAMVPAVSLLQLSGVIGNILAILAVLMFVSIQLTGTKKEAKKLNGPKRVKIRRVFDAW
jgi:hypothetical protein